MSRINNQNRDASGYEVGSFATTESETAKKIQPSAEGNFKENLSKTILVRSNFFPVKSGGFKLAIYEKHDAHKDGELYIADDKMHKVALTTEVAAAINDGRLTLVDEADYLAEVEKVQKTPVKETANPTSGNHYFLEVFEKAYRESF